jgi:hypothetical protein
MPITMASDHTLLLADESPILYRSGTEQIATPFKRHSANPVIAQDHPWEEAIGWSSVYRHPQTGKYQLWYQGYAKDQVPSRRIGRRNPFRETNVRFLSAERKSS